MATYLLDNFNGTGSLVGHTSDSGMTWTDGDDPSAPYAVGLLSGVGWAVGEYSRPSWAPSTAYVYLTFNFFTLPNADSITVKLLLDFSATGSGGLNTSDFRINLSGSGEELPRLLFLCNWSSSGGLEVSLTVQDAWMIVPSEYFGVGLHEIELTAFRGGLVTLKVNEHQVEFDSGRNIEIDGADVWIEAALYSATGSPEETIYKPRMDYLQVDLSTGDVPVTWFWTNTIRASEIP